MKMDRISSLWWRCVPASGVFIPLYDEDTLNLYLTRGVYGFLMRPVGDVIGSHTKHYAALGDYSCMRNGTHIFFFRKRRIVYGGEIKGPREYGAFYLNGPLSPMGRKAKARLVWDESKREKYQSTETDGVFRIPRVTDEMDDRPHCQPYIILFKDEEGLKGRMIQSDALYFKLGSYGYPLPSNAIQGMGFCTITPQETEILLTLLRNSNHEQKYEDKLDNEVRLNGTPVPFEPRFGIMNITEAQRKSAFVNESHLEATILANPSLLPNELKPNGATLCRQVPISPFKPFQMDRADICYYKDDCIADGTLPNTVIELKRERAGLPELKQVERYMDWLFKVAKDEFSRITFYLFAPSFARTTQRHLTKHRDQIRMVDFSGRGTRNVQATLEKPS